MGSLYAASPIDTDTRTWLTSEGTTCPDQPGRWPTPAELRQTLESLPNHHVAFTDKPTGGWDAEVTDARAGREDRRATVWVEPWKDEAFHHPFTLQEPDPEVAVAVLEALSRACGPYALYDSSSGKAVVVTPGCDPAEAIEKLG